MKKLERLMFVLICTLLLSGCVKMHTTMTIDSDKSMMYEQEVLMSSAITSMAEESTDEEAMNDYKSRGFKIEEIKDKDGYTGYKLSKKFDNIDNLSKGDGSVVNIGEFYDKEFDESKLFKLEKGFFKNTYTANFKYEVNNSEMNDGEATFDNETEELNETSEIDEEVGASVKPGEDENTTSEEVLTTGFEDGEEGNDTFGDLSALTSLMGEAEFTYVVNLPVAATSNNATSVTNDGKTLSWKIDQSGDNVIKYSFSLLNMTNVIIVCGGGILLILGISIALVVVSKNKKKKEDNFTPTVVNETKEGDTPINVENVSGSEEVNNSIETVNEQTVVAEPQTEMPVVEPTAEIAPVVQEEPVLENPVENMVNSVEPVKEVEPILNIEIPTIPEVPTATMEEISTVPMNIEEETQQEGLKLSPEQGIMPLEVTPSEAPVNPEFVMPTVDGSQPAVENNTPVENPEFVMPTVDETQIPEAPVDNNIQ